MSDYGVVLFHTTSAAFAAEKVLKKAGLECRLIPTPRDLSSNCGVAAEVNWDCIEAVRNTLETAGIDTEGIHKL